MTQIVDGASTVLFRPPEDVEAAELQAKLESDQARQECFDTDRQQTSALEN